MTRPLLCYALLAMLLVGSARPAAAESDRTVQVGLFAGSRSFASRLDLSSEFAAGGRVGLDLSRHASLLMDAVYTTPTRTTTDAFTRVIAVRTLVQVRPVSGRLRPYAIGGLGGMLFDFEDTPDASGGTLTGGFGVEYGLTRGVALYGEGSIDWYLNRDVAYAPTGERLTVSSRRTDQVR